MKVGPSEPPCRRRLQTARSCFGEKPRWGTFWLKGVALDHVMWGSERRAKANLWVKHRNRTMGAPKPGHTLCLGNSMEGTCLLAMRCPVQSRRESDPGFRTELENLVGSGKGKGSSGRTARLKVPMGQAGADCSVVAMRRGTARRAKGDGSDGRRQPSMGGTSRVSREAQARICERLGVQLPGPTRRCWATSIPTATKRG
jgi:hypothetical protein